MAQIDSLVTFLVLLCAFCEGLNPVVPDVGMADPHVHVFNGKFYMYATHDFSPNNTGFRMDDWWVWSSPDMVTWTKETILTPEQTPAPQSAWHECWATDGAMRNGSYYFYLSIGPAQVAVMSAPTPTGPWTDPLHHPLLTAAMGASLNPPTTIRDPGVLQDDDGNYYIIFGVFEYYIAKLNPDMISLAETPKHVQVLNALGPYGYGKTDDKPFLHKANGVYYLSWGCFYGTSNSPYGPFQYQGSVVSTATIAPDFRMNDTQTPWYGGQDYADRHGSFWTLGGQWFYSCNDRSHSTDHANPSVFRDTVLTYVHYYSNGSIAPVRIDGTGVGSYLGSGFEAEDYMSATAAAKHHTAEGAFYMAELSRLSVLTYPNVAVDAPTRLVLRASNGASRPFAVTAHRGTAAGPVLCSADVQPTGSAEKFVDTDCLIEGQLPSWLDIVLTFDGDDDTLAHAGLDSLSLV